ncbi:MAG: aminoglycoside phosphotransferase family protein [Caldilineaceae bacterium]|nr:aminoglycoside phosphotransferase family protein [Caldilineaceae bacterium]
MTEPTSPWQITLFAMIGHPGEAKILMRAIEAGWALPGFDMIHESKWLKQERIVEQMEREVGAPLFLLRWAWEKEDVKARRFEAILEMEWLSPLAAANRHWVDAADMASLPLARPEQRPLIELFLAELTSGVVPPLRAPWAQRGWLAGAQTWMQEQIRVHAGAEVNTFELVRTWDLSCVLRIHTATGALFYFKATIDLPLFVSEGVFTAGLAALYPEYAPHPLAVDEERGWMLLPHFDGEIEWDAPLAHRERLIRAFAAIQVDSTRRVDRLLAMGALDRRLAWMVTQIDPIFADLDGLDLTADESDDLLRIAPFLKERCALLATYNVPPALVHGDLHGNNVAFRADGLTIFDWTDACVTHPFFDMFIIYREEKDEWRQRLRQLYLAAWTDFEPIERLHELWHLAEPIFALHHTISYWTIARHGESRDLVSDFADYARRLLRAATADGRSQTAEGE